MFGVNIKSCHPIQRMNNITRNITLEQYSSIYELTNEQEIKLCEEALRATETAYAPYSKYKVGAACLLTNGEIIIGSNQENAVYPLTVCAERVAINSSCCLHPDEAIIALAVATVKPLKPEDIAPFPCGGCRQSMIEMEFRNSNQIKVFIVGSNRSVLVADSAKTLLPFSFDKNSL